MASTVSVWLLICVGAHSTVCSAHVHHATSESELDPDVFPQLFGDPHHAWASRISFNDDEEEEAEEPSAGAPSPGFLSSHWGIPPPPDLLCELWVPIGKKMTVSTIVRFLAGM